MEALAKSLSFDPTIFLLQVVTFLLLWGFLTFFFWKPILVHIHARHQSIEDAHKEVERARTEMETMRNDYQTRIAQVETEARTRIQTAIKEAQTERERILAEAKASADATLKQGVASMETEKNEALAGLRGQIVQLALDVSHKALGGSGDTDALRTLIEQRVQSN